MGGGHESMDSGGTYICGEGLILPASEFCRVRKESRVSALSRAFSV